MKGLIFYLAILGGALLGLALGFSFRGSSLKRVPSISRSTSSNLAPSGMLQRPHNQPAHTTPADDSPIATQLARDLSMTSGVTNWLCWWQALDQAMPSDFPRLLRLAKGNRLIARLIAERWAEIAPEHFFRTAVAAARSGNSFPPEVTNALLDTWLKRDSTAVINALRQTDDFTGRAEWRRDVASSIIEHNTELGLKLMSQWHIENFGPNLNSVETWAAADPRHAAEFTLANPAGYVSTSVIQAVGREWAKTAPADAMAFAIANPGNLGATMANATLQAWAARDLNGASAWLAEAPPNVQNDLCPAFVQAWAKQDPASALTWCESNLSGSSLIRSVSGLFNGAADKDVQAAAQLVLGMDPSPARAAGAAAVADKWFPSGLDSTKPIPSNILTWLNNLDSESSARAVENVEWRWAQTDPAGMAAFLQSSNAPALPSYTFTQLAVDLARKDPGQALDWASQLPEGTGLSAGSAAFTEWGRSQPESAMEWWKNLPATDPRRLSFFQGLLSQLAWDTQANPLFAQIAANDPAAARQLVASMSLGDERRSTLLSLLHQP